MCLSVCVYVCLCVSQDDAQCSRRAGPSMFIFVCMRFQCLTGRRAWRLFFGTVQETNGISSVKGGHRQLYHGLFEELKTQLYRKEVEEKRG